MSKSILVIGGGAVGLSASLEFARRGHQVRILDRQPPGRESSWAGAGILSMLLPWSYGPEVSALVEDSLARYPDWIRSLRAQSYTDPEYRCTGMLVLPAFDRAQAEAWHAARGRTVAALPDGLEQSVAGASGGLWLPEVAQLRNPRIVAALAEALASLGVSIHAEAEVSGLRLEKGAVAGVVTSTREWQAEHYVVAAGAWSASLLGDLGKGLSIKPIRGEMLLYQAAPGRLPCIVYQDGMYLVPRADGLILAGSTLDDVGFDKTTSDTTRARLHAFFARVLPDLATLQPIRHWAGLRPGSAGNVPTVARHPQIENLYLSSGHFRYGVTMAPGNACLLADLIDGRPPAVDSAPYAWPAAQAGSALL